MLIGMGWIRPVHTRTKDVISRVEKEERGAGITIAHSQGWGLGFLFRLY